jgi:hypothetical protein
MKLAKGLRDSLLLFARKVICIVSPHAWGWSEQRSAFRTVMTSFPTRVGMVRWLTLSLPMAKCFPHTRGDLIYEAG